MATTHGYFVLVKQVLVCLLIAFSASATSANAQINTWDKESCGKIESLKTAAVSMIGAPGQLESPPMRIPTIYLRKYTAEQIASEFGETVARTEIVITAIWPTLCPASGSSVNRPESRIVVDFVYAASSKGYMGRLLKRWQTQFEKIESLPRDELSLHKFKMSRKTPANRIEVAIVYADVGLEASDTAKIAIRCVTADRDGLCQVFVESEHNFHAALLLPRSELTNPDETGGALATLASEFMSLGLTKK